MIALVSCAVVVVALVVITASGRDLWPFSGYPMFAAYRTPKVARFFQLRLQLRDGSETGLVTNSPASVDEFNSAFGAAWAKTPTLAEGSEAHRILERFLDASARHRSQTPDVCAARVVARIAIIAETGAIAISEQPIGALKVIALAAKS